MPSRIELTRMPLSTSSFDSVSVMLSSAARAAEVAIMCSSGCKAKSEFTQVMEAISERSNAGKNACTGLITPNSFSSASCSQALRGV
ncbi:hypothetical protein D3C78_1794900 [compost metagenome]